MKFNPRFVEKPWGGNIIKEVRGDVPRDMSNIGECWNISAVPGNVTEVENGYLAGTGLDDLCMMHGEALLGRHVVSAFGNIFPMLVKLIDAHDNLSVQVHPNDEQARRIEGVSQLSKNVFGKNEMWYILRADDDAKLIDGFRRDLPREEYAQRVADGSFMDFLNVQPVREGEIYYIPSGRVHGIGGGVFLAEIQQSSDLTYRIYDYGRPRELHTEQASEVIDYKAIYNPRTDYSICPNEPVMVVDNHSFRTFVMECTQAVTLQLRTLDSFSIIMCVSGDVVVTSSPVSPKDADFSSVRLTACECCLIPAEIPHVVVVPLMGTARMLHTHIPIGLC